MFYLLSGPEKIHFNLFLCQIQKGCNLLIAFTFNVPQLHDKPLFDVTLVYCFEKKGVLRDENDDDSVIPEITRAEFEQYVADGVIQGGMIPKLENSFEAINAGVTEVVITLASAIKNNEGTRIKK